jgi:hypothetical protein
MPSPHTGFGATHVPLVQLSPVAHIWQVAPPVPQAVGDGVVHVVPEQHPLGQLEALQPLHDPLLQVSPVGHMVHMPPAAPHALGLVPGRHELPWQHPVGHDMASQMHWPPEQT